MSTLRHLTQTQVAARYQISKRTLEGWRTIGLGPKYIKLAHRVLYRLQDIEEFEEQNLRISTSERVHKVERRK